MRGSVLAEDIKQQRLKAHEKKLEEYRLKTAAMAENISQQMPKSIDNAIETAHKIEAESYDGVIGTPPAWVPKPFHQEFLKRRSNLLDQYSVGEVKKYLHEYKKAWLTEDPSKGLSYKTGFQSDNNYPQDIRDDLDFLCWLQHCVSLGEAEGLELLAGKDAVIGYKTASSASKGGRTKGKNFLPEREDILKIAKLIAEKRNKKPSKLQLARLVVREKYPNLKGESAEKKADVIRHWLD